jgi:hypothetical protein
MDDIAKLQRKVEEQNKIINSLLGELEKVLDDLDFVNAAYYSGALNIYECIKYLEDHGWEKDDIKREFLE